MPQKPAFGPEQYQAGDVIIRQGDIPDKFYIITRGRVEVVEQAPDGSERFVATLRAGDYVGEVGMMRRSRRVATVRALTDVNVMAMDRQTFANWLNSSDMIRDEIEALIERRVRPEQIQPADYMPPMRPANQPKIQTGFFETAPLDHMVIVLPGEMIVSQGSTADKFYVILAGTAEVIHQREDESERLIEELGAGDYFGEIGLLDGGERIASVRAKTGVKLLTFDRETFRSWMARNPKSQDDLAETAKRRLRETGRLVLPPEMQQDEDEEA